ncbi:MAG: amidohydrolase family protein [Anaerolineales bacterium]|nr:amidohydrolase family protein [Anaerolineales bacterium]
MQKVDTLIENGLIVTLDGTARVLPEGSVAIHGSTITAVGPKEEIAAVYSAETTVNAENHLVMPGLINAHTHLSMTLLRGLADDLVLEAFLERVWEAEEKFMNPPTIRLGAELAICEMIRGGTTFAQDMYWFPEATAEAARSAGFRLMNGPIFVDFEGADHTPADQREGKARTFLDKYADEELIHPCLMPHGTYTVSPPLLEIIKTLMDEYLVPLHTHASETAFEVATVQERYNETPVSQLDRFGMLQPTTTLAHGVHLAPEDIRLLAERGSAVVHCPVSNLKTAAGFAPLPALKEAGVPVLLGTDGTSSSNDLDMWKVLRFAAILARSELGDPTFNPALDVVRMATSDAARAMGLGEKLGSLEPGKYADLIMIELNKPHLTPLFDVYSQLVYAVGREDVSDVFIHGKAVMRDRRLLTLDENWIMYQARLKAEEIAG